jgi:hypothetical protein
MRKEDVTKEFLQEISQPGDYFEGVGLSMIYLFTRRYSDPPGVLIPGKGDPVVDPDEFFNRLDDAISKITSGAIVSFINNIALRVKEAILCDLNQMPKYINDPHVGAIARWRLRNGI